MPRVRIVCFGNLLHGDDAVGVHVARALRSLALPPSVEVVDAGTAGLGALACFEGCDKVIVVDAMAASGAPGRVHRLERPIEAPERPLLSTHAMGVEHLLAVLPIALEGERLPEVVVYGIEIASARAFCDSLSAPVAEAVRGAAARIEMEAREAAAP